MSLTSRDTVTKLTDDGVRIIVEKQPKKLIIVQILEPEELKSQKADQKSLKFK